MNKMIQTQLSHRTIRFFKERAVEPNQLQTYFNVMNRTATSNGLQSFSAIHITDPSQKERIAQVCHQPYVAKAPELVIFIVDMYRNAAIAKAKGYSGEKYRSMDHFFQGAADVYLASQNMVNAIESDGLGTVYLGSILNDPQAMIEILGLPELTFPLLGLAFGYPNDNPQLKPRIPVEVKLSENTYHCYDDYLELLKCYDEEMTQYYDTRFANQRVDSFTNQVLSRIEMGSDLRAKIIRFIEQQGFQLNL